MSSDEIAISARNLTKTYRLFGHPGDRIKQFFSLGLKRYHREFTALRDVSFDVRKGETVGIVGRNGSGKSTLLQLICGILTPTAGTVTVNGRIAALLELGAGFNPEFTGRENVHFQGALQGFTKEQMHKRFDAIATFADIGEFIDQPVRTYSSGMFVRLAFAAAIHTDPDILVVDEALAVGDMAFQRKCFDRIKQMQSSGITMLIVSHSPYWIERLCNRAVALEKGVVTRLAPAIDVLHLHHDLVQSGLEKPVRPLQRQNVTQEVYFERVGIESLDGKPIEDVPYGEAICIVGDVVAARPMRNVRFRFAIVSGGTEVVTQACSNGLTEDVTYEGSHRVVFKMAVCQLTSGSYSVDAYIADGLVELDNWGNAASFRVLVRDTKARDLSSDHGVFVCLGQWCKV